MPVIDTVASEPTHGQRSWRRGDRARQSVQPMVARIGRHVREGERVIANYYWLGRDKPDAGGNRPALVAGLLFVVP